MTELRFVAANGVTLELHNPSGGYGVIDVQGAGMPSVEHQTVTAPNRDGEVWVRALLGVRYLKVKMLLKGASQANRYALRQALIAAMNPKYGLGRVEYVPFDGAEQYEIGAVIEAGLGFDTPRGVAADEALISFRCPDPAWRKSDGVLETITLAGQGLSIPVSIPLSVSNGSVTETITNGGQLEAYPIVTVTAGEQGLETITLTNATTGQVLAYTVALAAGESLVIDTNARTALIGDTNALPYRTAESASPWVLADGDNEVTASVASGTGTITIAYDERVLGL